MVSRPQSSSLTRSLGVAALLAIGPALALAAPPPPKPKLTINSPSVLEGDTGTVNLVFTVTLSASPAKTVTVQYATSAGTATAAVDYTTTAGTLTFLAGTTTLTQTLAVKVIGDTVYEGDETLFVTLKFPKNALLGTPFKGTGTIQENDAAPSLSINDVSVTEGNGGTTLATFTVTQSKVSGRTVTVSYATANGTATLANGDYVATAGSFTFTAGSTLLTRTLAVVVNGDTLNEPDETYSVNLSAETNATVAKRTGVGTIVNDDLPQLSISDVTQPEGSTGGTTDFVFTVSLGFTNQPVMVNYATANGTAKAGSDYTTTGGTLTIGAGQTSADLTVSVNADFLNEADEDFLVNLSTPVNAVILDGQGTGTIQNDDPSPAVFINDVTVNEGDTGTVLAVFQVGLSAVSGQQITVDYAMADGTATVSGGDYVPTSGTLVFAAGSTNQVVVVKVNGDLLNELPSEDFVVNLANPNPIGTPITKAQGVGTITDDDPEPGILINDVAVVEGDGPGTTPMVFNVTLSYAAGVDVNVDYAVGGGTAVAGVDYDTTVLPSGTSGTLTFPGGVGNTLQTITVPAIGDVTDDKNVGFIVTLSNPVNAKLARKRAQGVIFDDDGVADPCRPVLIVPVTIAAPGLYCVASANTDDFPSGAAFTIDSDSVTLDLGRYLTRNTNGPGTNAYGVYASGRKNVTVENGTLRGFFTGVFLGQPPPYTSLQSNVITGVNVFESTYAGLWVEGLSNRVTASHVTSTRGTTLFGADADALGIVSFGGFGTISGNAVSNTLPRGAGTGYGATVSGGDQTVVSDNQIGNTFPRLTTGLLGNASTNLTVRANTFSELTYGIVISGGTTGSFKGNTMTYVGTPFVDLH